MRKVRDFLTEDVLGTLHDKWELVLSIFLWILVLISGNHPVIRVIAVIIGILNIALCIVLIVLDILQRRKRKVYYDFDPADEDIII